jgi:hypothetical protein
MNVALDDQTSDMKDIVFDLLKDKVENFTVSFDGSGDSGGIDSIELDPEFLEMKVEGVKVKNGIRYADNGPEVIYEDVDTLEKVIEGVCYEALGTVCSGWEINDGSYGEFSFDIENRKVVLDFNQRFTDVRNSEYSF